jgi:hypothetical protein
MSATHFQNIETTKCSATLALRMAGAGKIVATKFRGTEVCKIFKNKRKKNKRACVFKNKLETKVNKNTERKRRKARIKGNNKKQKKKKQID